jgi:hypothetical protein
MFFEPNRIDPITRRTQLCMRPARTASWDRGDILYHLSAVATHS